MNTLNFRPNLKHLEAVKYAEETGSILAASNLLNLSQPAVSQGLRLLERRLGAALFIRASTGLFATEFGKVFLARMVPAMHIFNRDIRARTGLKISPFRCLTMSQLRAVVAVAEQGSYQKASHAENLAQPTLHRACRTAERVLKVTFFERTSWGLTPTKQARSIAQAIKLFFSELDTTAREILEIGGTRADTCNVGAMPLARSGLVPKAVDQFLKHNPDFQISIIGATYNDLVDGLRDGRIDFLVGAMRGDQVDTDLMEEFLFDDPLSILMDPEHPLAKQTAITLQDLMDYSWVIPPMGTPLREQFHTLFSANARPKQVIECNALSAARVLLRDSERVMLLSDAQAAYEREAGLLVSKPLPISSKMTRSIGLTTRRDWRPTKHQHSFLNLIRRMSQNPKF